jgi:hypothetical protein
MSRTARHEANTAKLEEEEEQVWKAVLEELEEEASECPFCKYMKSGPCGEEFGAWEECVKANRESDEDYVANCQDVTRIMRECVDKNPGYYSAVVQGDQEGEKDAETDA